VVVADAAERQQWSSLKSDAPNSVVGKDVRYEAQCSEGQGIAFDSRG
jgi:hypothetical protein